MDDKGVHRMIVKLEIEGEEFSKGLILESFKDEKVLPPEIKREQKRCVEMFARSVEYTIKRHLGNIGEPAFADYADPTGGKEGV